MGFVTSKPASSSSLKIWAAENDIPRSSLAQAYSSSSASASIFALHHPTDILNTGLSPNVPAGKYIALDCEMVGVGPNPNDESALARVSIVNYHGEQVYDSFVLPKEGVTDYRTAVSGITPALLREARTFEEVQRDVAALMDGRIVVGHAVRNDLDALMLGHPKRDLRDTSRYKPYRKLAAGRTPGLKKLAEKVLGVQVQGGQHSSVEDARVTMGLYRKEKAGFEEEHVRKWGFGRKVEGKGVPSGAGRDEEGGRGKAKRRKKKVKK